MMVRIALLVAAIGLFSLPARRAQAAEPLVIELLLKDQTLIGRPLRWTHEELHLLGRDGRLWEIPGPDAKGYRRSKEAFQPLTKNELRAELQREFGNNFDVTSTGNYLVVHPAGQKDQWAQRFELLYRSFLHYFTARGYRPVSPPFPLVAIVFPRQQDFMAYAASEGHKLPPQVLGYYSPLSNRIALYDSSNGQGNQPESGNVDTLIHEAAHQTAFNTGVHSRWSMPPRWVTEGLGTMFEARGVWDSPHYPNQPDRINRGRLESFQAFAATRRPKGLLAEIVSSDRAFQVDPDGAYAEAWALTFFLAETEPRKYFDYLAKTSSHAPFVTLRGPERLKDFTSIFGDQLDLMEAKMLRYIDALK
ncbi:MAG TPA: DUF1570 domain-containing protein [Pirellulaceae bacterium]|nr:DUF1570 domain-containing protein [Pirellulaceae bacterium]